MIKLTDAEFNELVNYIRCHYGINLEKKRQLVQSRLASTLIAKNITNFTDYFTIVKSNSMEMNEMLNKLTTNHTYFYREEAHFDYLKEVFLPELQKRNQKAIRIWSAGCSSGEEAYTTIMTIKDYLGAKDTTWSYKIQATDLSTKVLNEAKDKCYSSEDLKGVPSHWITKYFNKVEEGTYKVDDSIKKHVEFSRLNLMENFKFPPFDLIFCRNVMIYFQIDVKENLCAKFYDNLKPGGYLFIGHSETIQREHTKFKYIKPAIYLKEEN